MLILFTVLLIIHCLIHFNANNKIFIKRTLALINLHLLYAWLIIKSVYFIVNSQYLISESEITLNMKNGVWK